MSLFWHSSHEERGYLVRTLNELGPTTVPGLSAALSWPEKRTERLVRELARTGEGGVVYHPESRRVEIPCLSTPAASLPPMLPPSEPAGPPKGPTPLPAQESPVVPPRWSGPTACPRCSAPMEPTAHAEALVCSRCGQLTGVRRASNAPVAAGSSPRAPAPASGPAGPIPERRLQELFAAYVSSRPVICPKCKTPFRHRGLGMYGCPACGQVVRFALDGQLGNPAGPVKELHRPSAPVPARAGPEGPNVGGRS